MQCDRECTRKAMSTFEAEEILNDVRDDDQGGEEDAR